MCIQTPNNKPSRPTTAKPSAQRRIRIKPSKTLQTNVSGGTGTSVVSFPRSFNMADPFPVAMRKQLTYSDIFSMTTGNGLLGTQQAMRLNSVYDPDYSGAGHQPYGFDQLSGLYSKYRVDKVRFELVFTTPGGGSDILCVATVSPGGSSGLTGAALSAVQERPDGIWGVCSSSGERRCVLKGQFDNHVIAGVSRGKYEAEDNYSAAVSGNPSQDILLSFNVGCVDGTNAESAKVIVVITYDVVFFNRITQSQS